jgi:prepilin-type N-terminal cleavage/methylation domain-containing protein/prepilin-type processing-associated H-X9-DG protein
MAARRGFTLIELLVTIAIIGTLVAMLLPAVQQARETARKSQCASHLKQLALGLHNYNQALRMLPPGAYVQGSSFPIQTGWGWGAMILPHVDQGPLYNRIDFNHGTAFGTNVAVIATSLPLYLCPSDPSPERFQVTPPSGPIAIATANYAGVVNALEPMSTVRFRDISDGLSNTLLVGERKYQRGDGNGDGQFTSGWYGYLSFDTGYLPNSLPYEETAVVKPINHRSQSAATFGSRHAGGAQFAFADGSVRFLSENINRNVYQALGSIAGGEAVNF